MGRTRKAARVAYRAAVELLAIGSKDDVLIVADESATEDCQEIIDALSGLSSELANSVVVCIMNDVRGDSETIPPAVAQAMHEASVLVGLTQTTSASFTHHDVPLDLRADGELRALGMTKRSFSDLTSPTVLDVDFAALTRFGARVRDQVTAASEIRVTSERGTDLVASIDGMPSMSTAVAHTPGDITVIGWGEVYQGPVVGTAEGTAVIDGPILGYGWPTGEVEVVIESGEVTALDGDPQIVTALETTLDENENARNLAEIAFGINPYANRRSTSIWKKGRGRTHIGIGNGLIYGQDIDSPIHIDFVMNDASVTLDGAQLIDSGSFVDDETEP